MAIIDSGTAGYLKKVGRIGIANWEIHDDDDTLILYSTDGNGIDIRDKRHGKNGNNIFKFSETSCHITEGTKIALLRSNIKKTTGEDIIIPQDTKCQMEYSRVDNPEDERFKDKDIHRIKLNIDSTWFKPHNLVKN